MAADLNRCEFIGRLGRDVEVIAMKNGENMAKFSIAVGESYMNKQGERVKLTEWVNIVAYRKLAEICSKYLAKGSKVYVAGKLNTNKYTGKDGTEKLSVQIILDNMQMLDSKQQEEEKPVEQATESAEELDSDIPF